MKLTKKFIAEAMGTSMLVGLSCGVAIATGASVVPTALAFGLTYIATYFIIGHISGCHINPAVSFAMLLTKRLSIKEFFVYILAQFIGALMGSFIIGIIFMNKTGFTNLASNAIGINLKQLIKSRTVLEPDLYKINALSYVLAFIIEVLLTDLFIMVVLNLSTKNISSNLSCIIVGITLIVVHLLGINLTGTSVNPARSFAPALIEAIAGNTLALSQVWIFILAPFVGSIIATIEYNVLLKR